MQSVIDKYFQTDAYVGEGDNRFFCPTIAGLAYALDLTRQSLINYEVKEEFLDTIKKAKMKVEISLEQRLAGNSVTGSIFNLKNNFGWKDKTETEHSGSINFGNLTDEQIDEEIKKREAIVSGNSG